MGGLNNKNAFLIDLEVEKSKINVLIDLVLFFACRWPSHHVMVPSHGAERKREGGAMQFLSFLLFVRALFVIPSWEPTLMTSSKSDFSQVSVSNTITSGVRIYI